MISPRRRAHARSAGRRPFRFPPRRVRRPTGVKTCNRHAHTRGSRWSSASLLTAARQPAQLLSSSWCTRELAGVHVNARPRRIGQGVAVANPKSKLRAAIRPATDHLDCLLEIGWHSIESVHQERVVGNLRRQPVCLRIDCCKPARRHAPSQTRPMKSTIWRATASGCSSCKKWPAPSTTNTSPPGGRTRSTHAM